MTINKKEFIDRMAKKGGVTRCSCKKYIDLKDDENNKDVLLKLGTCYVRANQDEKALEPYLKVLEPLEFKAREPPSVETFKFEGSGG